MVRYSVALCAVGLASGGCDRSEPIAPEPDIETQTQGLGPAQRTKTADTDAAQLRSFHVFVPFEAPNDSVAVVEGPFVITTLDGYPLYVFINFAGECPPPDAWGTDAFNQDSVFVSAGAGARFVPAGAVVCAGRAFGGVNYAYNISGYVPYE